MVVLARRRSRPYPINVRPFLSRQSLERIERRLYEYSDDVAVRAATKITSMGIMSLPGSVNHEAPPESPMSEEDVNELVLKHYIGLNYDYGDPLIIKPKAIKDQI